MMTCSCLHVLCVMSPLGKERLYFGIIDAVICNQQLHIKINRFMWAHPRMMLEIYWIILWSFVQAQGFSTTVVKVGEDAIIECGLQTKAAEDYLRWQAITNDIPEELAYDLIDRIPRCNDRIIKCTLYANGSIQLESVSMEDGARYYRCLRGDDNGYNYYSDHRLLVLSKEAPSISQSPTSAIAFKASRKGIIHSYGEPVCEDDVDGNLPVVCSPPSGVIVDREYVTIQCNCTDSDGLMDNVTFPVTTKMSSPPSIEAPHRESVSSYNMGEKGVLHGYNATVCEDDVDGNLPVVCYPPSGIIVDKEYESIQCNCTDSDGLMDNVTFPVTSLTHWVHPGWMTATISLSVISILISLVLISICCYLYMKLKKSKAYHPVNNSQRELAEREEEVRNLKDQLEMLKHKIAALEGTLNNRQTELKEREEEVSHLTDQLEQKEKQETEMKNKLEEQHKKISKRSTQRESQVMCLEGLLEIHKKMLETMKNKLEEQLKKNSKRSTQRESQVMCLEGQLEIHKKMLETMKNNLEEQNKNISKRVTQWESQVTYLKQLLEMGEKMLETIKNYLEEQHENIFKRVTQRESQVMRLEGLHGNPEMREKMLETKNNLEEQHEKNMKIAKEMALKGWKNRDLNKQLEEKQDQKICDWDQAACEHQCKEEPQGILEENKIAALEGTLNNRQTELEEVSHLTDQLEQKEEQETEMENKLEEKNEKIIQIEKELAVKEAENIRLVKLLEEKQQQKISD